MGNELVTDSDSRNTADGCANSRQSAVLRYGDKFKELCSLYMSIGMSYEEYWDGDAELPVYYRDSFQRQQTRQNEYLWLQGRYIYDALCAVYPIFNSMSKKKRPLPYRDMPIPLTRIEKDRQDAERKEKQMQDGIELMKRKMVAVNKQFEKKGKGG